MAKETEAPKEAQNNLIIDVDLIIDKYNKDNPDKRQLDRKALADILGVNKQLFVDWKAGKTPSVVFRLLKLMEIGGCQLDFFVKDAV